MAGSKTLQTIIVRLKLIFIDDTSIHVYLIENETSNQQIEEYQKVL